MTHTPSHLERIFRHNEDCVDPETILAEINDVVNREAECAKVEHTIRRRVHAMLQYLFGVCQTKPEKRETAARAAAPLERLVSQHVSEMGDPQQLMEEYVNDDVFDPNLAEALYAMEDALHEKKDPTKPAAKKQSLRDLMKKRGELDRMAA